MPPLRRPRRLARLFGLMAAVTALLVGFAPGASAATATNSKTDCAYSAHSIATLNAFSTMVGQPINCAMVYVNATTTWQQWESPWIINDRIADNDWSAWATAPGTHRQLVITQDLIPNGIAGTDWLDAGAAGAYTGYAQTFAQNLVNAGLGNSVIRLAPEANGTWFADSYGTTPAQWASWVQFWRQTVIAMKSVSGANFQFDWCVATGYRALPLAQIYPGSDLVDIIGFDVYDDGNIGTTGPARWNTLLNENGGIQSIINFAKSQGKPISIPEWGVNPVADGGGGDDPTFVNGIANLVENNPTAYQSYFYKYGQATQLAPGTQSLTAYQNDFTSSTSGTSTGAAAQPSGAATSTGSTAATATSVLTSTAAGTAATSATTVASGGAASPPAISTGSTTTKTTTTVASGKPSHSTSPARSTTTSHVTSPARSVRNARTATRVSRAQRSRRAKKRRTTRGR